MTQPSLSIDDILAGTASLERGPMAEAPLLTYLLSDTLRERLREVSLTTRTDRPFSIEKRKQRLREADHAIELILARYPLRTALACVRRLRDDLELDPLRMPHLYRANALMEGQGDHVTPQPVPASQAMSAIDGILDGTVAGLAEPPDAVMGRDCVTALAEGLSHRLDRARDQYQWMLQLIAEQGGPVREPTEDGFLGSPEYRLWLQAALRFLAVVGTLRPEMVAHAAHEAVVRRRLPIPEPAAERLRAFYARA